MNAPLFKHYVHLYNSYLVQEPYGLTPNNKIPTYPPTTGHPVKRTLLTL